MILSEENSKCKAWSLYRQQYWYCDTDIRKQTVAEVGLKVEQRSN